MFARDLDRHGGMRDRSPLCPVSARMVAIIAEVSRPLTRGRRHKSAQVFQRALADGEATRFQLVINWLMAAPSPVSQPQRV